MISERRRRLVVDLRFQLRQLLPVFMAAAAGAIAGGALAPASGLMAGATSAFRSVASSWLYAGLVALPLAAVVYVQILRSHHVAGPALRLRRILQRLGDGDLSVHMRLREGDDLQEVAEALGSAGAGLRAKVVEAQTAAAGLRHLICPPNARASEGPRATDEELAMAVQRLEAALRQFRTVPRGDGASGRRPLLAPERVEFIPPSSQWAQVLRRQRRLLPEGV